MPKQSIIWTVLPNGVTPDGKSLRVSVLVSPRLDAETEPKTLESFSDFHSWPATLKRSSLTLNFGPGSNSVALNASMVDPSTGIADEPTWLALFPRTTSVLSPKLPDRTGQTVVSYDTVAMNNTVARIYEKLTLAPGNDLPSMEQLLTNLKPVVESVAGIDRDYFDKEKKIRDVGKMFTDYKNGALKKYDTDELKLGSFQMFHTPPNAVDTTEYAPKYDPRLKARYQNTKSVPFDVAKIVSAIDFHQIVAAMNQYPTLLRRLGLVIDYLVPRTNIPKSADFTMSVTAKLLDAAPIPGKAVKVATRRSANPVTRAKHTDTDFCAVSRPSAQEGDLQVGDGMLKLAGRFSLLQADVDGAGHKLINFARTLANHVRPERQLDPITKLPRRAGAPALRNAGLMLVHQQRGKALGNSFVRSKALNDKIKQMFEGVGTPSTALYAEDLVRGWRIDIWDKTSGKWRSLCERVSDYDINKGAVVLAGLREEGIVRLAATSSTDGSNADAVWLHEAVTVWNGWSLVAQQPGRAIDRNDENLRDAAGDIPDGIRLKTHFVSRPGTLPKLRYGRVYALRARAVDLAGNSLSPKTSNYPGDDNAIASATPYFRFEPVQPPAFALVGTKQGASLPKAGESMARAVVRSFNAQFDDPTLSGQEAQRWAVAARTSQREAELHGVLDGAEWGTPQQYAMLAARDNELAQFDVVPQADEPLTGPITTVPNIPGMPVISVADQERAKLIDKEDPRRTSYAVLPAGSQLLPYLPDPLCTRVVVRFYNHPLISAHEPVIVPLYREGKKWPDVSPVLVRVYEAAGEVPRFDVATHTLLVPTPKATRATLKISSMLDDETLKLLGVWNWVKEASRDEALKRRARGGVLWPLTPARELEVVHAVQRPLLKPDILNLNLNRNPGATWVKPTVVAMCHRNSTIKVDLHAVWNDPRDAAITGPANNAKDAVPFSIKITDPQGYNGIIEHVLPENGPADSILFGEIKVKPGETTPVIEAKVHDFGDTRYRRVEYQLIGTSRFREYMSSEVLYETNGSSRKATDANIKLEGTPRVAWVLSSAPPPAPEVLYVVPTFGWTRGVDSEGKTTSWRQGGGIRVWLDRPWNATGYGEMLAVVIPRKGSTTEPNDPPYKHTVTQWGNDPVWQSPFVKGVAPLETHFPLRRMAPDATGAWLPPGAPATEADQPHEPFATAGLIHPGVPTSAPTGRVDIVPHDVFWDPERGLWYCDIEIAHGASYFPFVRLALARYQPGSIPENYLSNVVLADFCSLAPNRWLTISGSNPTRRSITVYGMAPSGSSGYAEAYQFHTETKKDGVVTVHMPVDISKSTVIEVWVEKLTPGQGEDFGWHKVATGTESKWQAATPKVSTGTVAAKPKVGTAAAKPKLGTSNDKQVIGQTTAANRSDITPQKKARAERLMDERDYKAVLKESLIEATIDWPTLWNGSIDLPTAPSANARYRVVVAEYEEYLADGDDAYVTPPRNKGRRLVFVEHVELT